MVQKVMPRTFLSISEDHLKIGELLPTIDRSACYNRVFGDLDSVVVKSQGSRLKSEIWIKSWEWQITKIIHQTWKTTHTREFQAFSCSWRNHHPGWE